MKLNTCLFDKDELMNTMKSGIKSAIILKKDLIVNKCTVQNI